MGTETGANVARNIKAIRRARGLSLRDLELALAKIEHPIALSALSKVENLARRVDVDDLTAIAMALDVSPLALLIPATRSHLDEVGVTGAAGPAGDMWRWAVGERPLDDTLGDRGAAEAPEAAWRRHEFARLARPWWGRPEIFLLHEGLSPEVLARSLELFDEGELGQGALRPSQED